MTEEEEYEKAMELFNKRVFWIQRIFGTLFVVLIIVAFATGGITVDWFD